MTYPLNEFKWNQKASSCKNQKLDSLSEVSATKTTAQQPLISEIRLRLQELYVMENL